MNILGVSFDFHDAAAVLLQNGTIVAAAQEERFSRKKNDPGLPKHAMEFCLQQGGIQPAQLDYVVFYENPLLKLDRIVRIPDLWQPQGRRYLISTLKKWMIQKKWNVKSRLAQALNIPQSKVKYLIHHDTHAASAWLCSPFETATIVTLDGVGEYETATISIGANHTIERLSSVKLPHSLGLFYSAITAFLGFEVNEGEYKVMGMAGFGKPDHFPTMMDRFSLHGDGTFSLRQDWFNFTAPEELPYTEKLIEQFGPPREPESPFVREPDSNAYDQKSANLHYANIAASAQKCTEEVILHMVSKAIQATGITDVCMAGGVALNSLANGRIIRELGCRLFVQPAAGDAGGALGAAMYYQHCVLQKSVNGSFKNAYLGREYDNGEIENALKKTYTTNYECFELEDDFFRHVARLLYDGAVIGWFQNRFEWGPRALGSRSILANPARLDMQNIVNQKIKFREPFRPFAPSVLEEWASEYFAMEKPYSQISPEYFMLAVCDVRPEKRDCIPAVTHVDGTARVQLVSRQINPVYYRLIESFHAFSGVPLLLNTSFNLRGEPIVNTPLDAIKTFEWSDMDYLVLGRYVIKKELRI